MYPWAPWIIVSNVSEIHLHFFFLKLVSACSLWNIKLSLYHFCMIVHIHSPLLTYWMCCLNDKNKSFNNYRTTAPVTTLLFFVAIYKETLHHASSTSLLPSPQAFFLFHFIEVIFLQKISNFLFFFPPKIPQRRLYSEDNLIYKQWHLL